MTICCPCSAARCSMSESPFQNCTIVPGAKRSVPSLSPLWKWCSFSPVMSFHPIIRHPFWAITFDIWFVNHTCMSEAEENPFSWINFWTEDDAFHWSYRTSSPPICNIPEENNAVTSSMTSLRKFKTFGSVTLNTSYWTPKLQGTFISFPVALNQG